MTNRFISTDELIPKTVLFGSGQLPTNSPLVVLNSLDLYVRRKSDF